MIRGVVVVVIAVALGLGSAAAAEAVPHAARAAAPARASEPIRDGVLAACIRKQQRADGSAVTPEPTVADLAKLTRLICGFTHHNIHLDGFGGIDQLAKGKRLRTLSFCSEAPPVSLAPLAALHALRSLRVNGHHCRLPVTASGTICR